MGLLDLKSRKPVTDNVAGLFHKPLTAPSAEPVSPVIRSTDVEKNPARNGLTTWNDNEPFVHYCRVCGAWGAFGFEVDILKDRLGRWYCVDHRTVEP